MTKTILKYQIQRNVFAYVDDIVVASRNKKCQHAWGAVKAKPGEMRVRCTKGQGFGFEVIMNGGVLPLVVRT
jgi:hypothetical protein